MLKFLSKDVEYQKKAIGIKPDFALAYNNLANVYFVQDSLNKALSYYKEASRLNPHLVEALFYAGVSEQKLGHSAAAEALWRRVLQIAPNHKGTLAALRSLSNK